jgi:hypothetical protein
MPRGGRFGTPGGFDPGGSDDDSDPTGGGANEDTGSTSPSSGGGSDPDPPDDDGPRTGGGSPSFPGTIPDDPPDPDPEPDPDPPDDDPTGGGANEDTGSTSPSSGGGSDPDPPDDDPDPSPGPSSPGGSPSVPGGVGPEPPEPDPDPTGGGANERTGSSSPGSGLPEDELRREAAEQNPRFDPSDFTVEDGAVVVNRDEATGGSGLVDARLAPGRRAELTDAARLETIANANSGVEPGDLRLNDGEVEVRPGAFDEPGADDADLDGDPTTDGDADQSRLEELDERFTEDVAEPVGEAVGDTTPIVRAEEAIFGTDRLERVFESAGRTIAQGANVPGAILGTRSAIQTVDRARSMAVDPVVIGGVDTGVRVPDPAGQVEVAEAGAATGVAAANRARERPFSSAGTVLGGATLAVGAPRVASGTARIARRAADDLDGSTTRAFVDDERARADGGGRRTTDTVEQETIEVEDVVGEQRTTGTDDIEDIPGVSIQNRGGGVPADEQLARVIEDAADDTADAATSPRARAERRVPDADEFPGGEAQRQREIEELIERFRREQREERTGAELDVDALDDVDVEDLTQGERELLEELTGQELRVVDDTATVGQQAGTAMAAAAAAAGEQASGVEQTTGADTSPTTATTAGVLAPGGDQLADTDLDVAADTDLVAGVAADQETTQATDQTTVTDQPTATDTTTTTDQTATTTQITDTTQATDTTTSTRTTATTAATTDTTTETTRPRVEVGEVDPVDEEDFDELDAIGETFTNPTRGLDEVSQDLTEGLDGP